MQLGFFLNRCKNQKREVAYIFLPIHIFTKTQFAFMLRFDTYMITINYNLVVDGVIWFNIKIKDISRVRVTFVTRACAHTHTRAREYLLQYNTTSHIIK